eukprot:324364-Karenia_brevis.AAC.1
MVENEIAKTVDPAATKTVESASNKPAKIERDVNPAASHGNVTGGKSSAFPTAAAERAKAV